MVTGPSEGNHEEDEEVREEKKNLGRGDLLYGVWAGTCASKAH